MHSICNSIVCIRHKILGTRNMIIIQMTYKHLHDVCLCKFDLVVHVHCYNIECQIILKKIKYLTVYLTHRDGGVGSGGELAFDYIMLYNHIYVLN